MSESNNVDKSWSLTKILLAVSGECLPNPERNTNGYEDTLESKRSCTPHQGDVYGRRLAKQKVRHNESIKLMHSNMSKL